MPSWQLVSAGLYCHTAFIQLQRMTQGRLPAALALPPQHGCPPGGSRSVPGICGWPLACTAELEQLDDSMVERRATLGTIKDARDKARAQVREQ